MNTFLILVVQLILGIVFGIIIFRMFHPELMMPWGIVAGVVFVALSYGFKYYRASKKK